MEEFRLHKLSLSVFELICLFLKPFSPSCLDLFGGALNDHLANPASFSDPDDFVMQVFGKVDRDSHRFGRFLIGRQAAPIL